ncbi:MAG: DUF5928 domain-containing protein [Pseudomonadota bacterium]
MVKLAFILLCHRWPDAIEQQVRDLTAAGDGVVIHLDGRSPRAAERQLRKAFQNHPNVVFTGKRVACGWGEWSLVRATLEGMKTALQALKDATHLYLISGDCAPIKPAQHVRAVLAQDPRDRIESHDFYRSDWIRTGLKEDRLRYRHIFNERKKKRLFYACLEAQRWLALDRSPPDGVEVRVGSQWWCLKRETAQAVLRLCEHRRDLLRFFSTTWIPDETFFQTLVPMILPQNEYLNRSPTFLSFTDYGQPVTFHDDHRSMLATEDAFFARKIAPGARTLRADLGKLWASGSVEASVPAGATRHTFLAKAGRRGLRSAPRFWEAAARIGEARSPLFIACKRWEIGKRLVSTIRQNSDLPALGYIFNDPSCSDTPHLGGLGADLAKRSRHRRAFLKLLFEHFQTDRLVVCVDPCMADAISDLSRGSGQSSLLDIQCALTDGFLEGHARRLGLISRTGDPQELSSLLPVVRCDLEAETRRLSDVNVAHRYTIMDSVSPDELALALAQFLGVTSQTAQAIAAARPLTVT